MNITTKRLAMYSLMLLLIVLAGCGSTTQFSPGIGNKYAYKFKMTYPVESN